MLFPISPCLSSSILFAGLLIHCRGLINIPAHNNPESDLFLHQWWYLLVTCITDLQGLFSWGKCKLIRWSVNLLSFRYFPVETDRMLRLLGRLWYRVISFQIWLLEIKQNVFSALATIFFNIVGFTFLLFFFFPIKLSLDIVLSILWGLTFYLVSSPALLEASNNPVTWLRSFPGLRQLRLSRSWAAFKMTFLQS